MYPDILHQYLTSYVPNRSSDVIITSSDGYQFGKIPRIGWRFGYHKGTHGGPSFDEMVFSPIIFGGCRDKKDIPLMRSKDLIKKVLSRYQGGKDELNA